MESITGEPRGWRGAMIGALVGLLYAAVGLGVGFFELMNDPGESFLTHPPESIIYRLAGGLGALIAGILAGSIGGWIVFVIADPADGSWKRAIKNLSGSLVGGAIGSLIGTAVIWTAYFGWEAISSGSLSIVSPFVASAFVGILSSLAGALIGLIAGFMIALLGETFGAIVPLALASLGIGFTFGVPGRAIEAWAWSTAISEIVWMGFAVLRWWRNNLFGQEWSQVARNGALGAAFSGVIGAAFGHFALAASMF